MSQLQSVKGKRARNYEYNGGAEGTGNAAFSGAGARAKAHAKTGQWSYALNNETLTLTGAALTNAPHLVTCWVYGDDPSSIAVGATVNTSIRLIDRHGDFKRFGALFTAAQCNTVTTRKVTATGVTWVDDVCTMLADDWDDVSEAFDGDTPGCRWLAQTYNSTSYRPESVLDNGQILDVDDTETVWLVKMGGATGLMPLDVIKQEAARGNRSLYQDTQLKERAIRLELFVKVTGFTSAADAIQGWHKRIRRLMRLFPVRGEYALRYIAASRVQEYRVVTVGMESADPTATTGNAHGTVIVMLTALDPRPRELTENYVSLTMNRSLTLSYLTARDATQGGQWVSRGSGPGAGVRRVYVAPDHAEYVCTVAASGSAYVKRRNADDTFTTIATLTGSITAGPVAYDCVQSPDGTKLYIVGDFTTVDGVTGFGGLATVTLSGLTKANMGTGCSGGYAERCRLSPSGDYLIIVGSFTSVSGTSAARVAKRLLSSGAWSAYASGLNGTVRGLVVNQAGDLFCGGDMTASSGMNAPAAPSGSDTTAVGSTLLYGYYKYCLTYTTALGETEAGATVTVVVQWFSIASFRNQVDLTFAAGSGITGKRLWRTETGGSVLYFLTDLSAGSTSYSDTGNVTLDKTRTPPPTNTSGHRTPGIARWDAVAAAWKSVGLTGFSGGVVYDLDIADNGIELVAVGTFTSADGNAAAGVAWFGGSQWLPCGAGVSGGTAYSCLMLSNGRTAIVGAFTSAGGMTAGAYLAYWTGGTRGAWLPADIVLPSATYYSVAENYDDILMGHTSTGSATAAALTTVTVAGTAGSQPIWEVLGGCTLRALINQRNGTALWFSEAAVIAASEIWRFDSADLVKTLTSTGQPGSLVGRILVGSDRGAWGMEPEDNDILMLAYSTSGTPAANFRDRTTNLSADGSETDE